MQTTRMMQKAEFLMAAEFVDEMATGRFWTIRKADHEEFIKDMDGRAEFIEGFRVACSPISSTVKHKRAVRQNP